MADTPEIVQYSYRAEKDDEIDLVIGDVVLVCEKSEDGRCKGVIGEREGWFPGNCATEGMYDCCTVCITFRSLLCSSSLVPKSTQAIVETPHHGDDDGELDLEIGDVVFVLVKRDSHRWIGQLKGKNGLFPAKNVKEIKGTVVHMLLLLSNDRTLPQYMSV